MPRTSPWSWVGGHRAVGSPWPKGALCVFPRRTDVPGPGRYRNWNPPLLGNLPEDFLRILPQQAPRTQVRALLRPGAEPRTPGH